MTEEEKKEYFAQDSGEDENEPDDDQAVGAVVPTPVDDEDEDIATLSLNTTKQGRELCNLYDANDDQLYVSFDANEMTRLKALTENERDIEFEKTAYKLCKDYEECREWGEMFATTQVTFLKEYTSSL